MIPISEAINAFADLNGKNLYCRICSKYFDFYPFFAYHIQDDHPELLDHLCHNFDNIEDAVKYLNTSCHRGAPFAQSSNHEFLLSPFDTLEVEK
jgi:hypothetical protein